MWSRTTSPRLLRLRKLLLLSLFLLPPLCCCCLEQLLPVVLQVPLPPLRIASPARSLY
jgi:hypothetical protein